MSRTPAPNASALPKSPVGSPVKGAAPAAPNKAPGLRAPAAGVPAAKDGNGTSKPPTGGGNRVASGGGEGGGGGGSQPGPGGMPPIDQLQGRPIGRVLTKMGKV